MPKINNNTGITSSAYCTVLNNQSRQQQQNKLNLIDCGLKLAWRIYFIYAKITSNLEVLLLTFYKYCNIFQVANLLIL